MLGFPNTQQPNQQPLNNFMNPNPSFNQGIQPTFPSQQPIQQQPINALNMNDFAVRELMEKLRTIASTAQDKNIQCLLKILENSSNKSKQILQKVTANPNFKPNDTQAQNNQKNVRERCTQIRNKNQILLKQLLNIRQNLIRQMYMYKVRAPVKEIDLGQVTQRIRNIKERISHKYHDLRFKRINQLQFRSKSQPKIINTTLNIPLTELVNATEIVQKQTLKMRQELSIVTDILTGRISQV